nr:rhabdomeric opsin [Macrobiotus pallari]
MPQVAPLAFITFCYIHIVQEVTVYMQKFGVKSEQASKKMAPRCGSQRVDVKTTKTSALIVAGWCVAWTPYTIVALLAIFSDRTQLTPLVAHIPALFAKTAAVYNPISKQLIFTSAHVCPLVQGKGRKAGARRDL